MRLQCRATCVSLTSAAAVRAPHAYACPAHGRQRAWRRAVPERRRQTQASSRWPRTYPPRTPTVASPALRIEMNRPTSPARPGKWAMQEPRPRGQSKQATMKVYELLAASGRPGNDGDGTRAYLSVPVWLAVCLHARDKMHACPAAACPFGILDTVRCKRNATNEGNESAWLGSVQPEHVHGGGRSPRFDSIRFGGLIVM
jgi:hypothetical protein